MRRIEVLSDELHYARMAEDKDVITSIVPLSVKKGGSTVFRRAELIFDLESELKHERFLLRLTKVDQEFHMACATSKPHIECEALHRYKTMLWTTDAREALEAEHGRNVARLVSEQIVEGILDWMLQGWHFGEYERLEDQKGGLKESAAGDELREQREREAREAEEDRVAAFTLPPGVEGSAWNPTGEKVVKPGGIHDLKIRDMEKAARFGLFTLTLMYFRSAHVLRQQKKWRAGGTLQGRASGSSVAPSEERVVKVGPSQPGRARLLNRSENDREATLNSFADKLNVERRQRHAVARS